MDKMKCLYGRKIFLVLLASVLIGNIKAQDTLKLTLDKALEIALSENPTIKVAGQEIQLKKEARREAYAGLFPEVSLSGSYSRNIKIQKVVISGEAIQMGTENNYAGGINVSLPVYAPALYKSIGLTKTDVNLAVEKSRASKIDMINQVTKAYYQLLLAQDSYAVLQKAYTQSEDSYNVINAKYQQGSASEYDKISAEVQWRSYKPTVVSAANAVNLTTMQLKVLMGMEIDMSIFVEGNLKDYEMIMFQRQLDPNPLMLDNNTDLRQLDFNATMLNQNLKLQRTNFLPMLALSFNYGYSSMNSNFKFGDYKWYPNSAVSLNLSIPLFKASNFTKVKQTKIQISQLSENRINVERQLNMQVKSYTDNMNASTEQVVSNKTAVLQAQKAREIASKRYEVGKGTVLELNSSEVALTQAELTYNQSIFDFLTAKADLDKVLGREEIIK